jgi:hypothetical protein
VCILSSQFFLGERALSSSVPLRATYGSSMSRKLPVESSKPIEVKGLADGFSLLISVGSGV